MSAPDQRTRYLSNMATDEIWRSIQRRHDEYGDLLKQRRETREKAIGHRVQKDGVKDENWVDDSPRWFDRSIGQSIRAWQLFPYNDTLNQEHLADLFILGKICTRR